DYGDLNAGWDVEAAAKPSSTAIRDAIRFVRAAEFSGMDVEPTPHVDGSILLEIDDGATGSLRFKGDGNVIYAIAHRGRGIALFNGISIPDELRSLFAA
ncbi:hypothetical protein V5F44_19375, partial [Xanthobacter sp. V2C-8]